MNDIATDSLKLKQKLQYHLITSVAIIWCLFQLYTAYSGILSALLQRSIHLLFALTMVFLVYTFKKTKNETFKISSLLYFGLIWWSVGYIALNHVNVWMQTGAITFHQEMISLMIILLIIEATRRTIGMPLAIISIVFLLYAYFGNYLSGPLQHKGYDVSEILRYQVMGLEGVFGVALGVAATFIFLFIFYAGVLQASGGGDFFINIATSLFGRVRGGPAKISVLSSSLFGSISGSAVANVAGTGTFTIPLMKKTGYSARFSGAVEAVSSSGGQFMPPIMGASAFLIAEILEISFWEVAMAAAIPAILYYLSIFIMVDLEASKRNIRGMDKKDVPSKRETLKHGWHFIISPVVLVYLLMVVQWSPTKAGFWTIIVTILSTFINPKNRMTFSQIINSMRTSAIGTLETTVACACVGMVVGVIMQTGLGFSLSSLIIQFSQGNVILLLVLTMICSLILGMGLPTVAAYIILSIMVAPTLISMGINPIASHLFIFYFGIISAITPPVALASYVAAGLSGDKPLGTSLVSLKLGLPAFLLPFMFVLGPQLILEGSAIDVILSFLTAVIGIFALAVGVQMYFTRKLNYLESGLLIMGALLSLHPNYITDIIGIGMSVVVILFIYLGTKTKQRNIEADKETEKRGVAIND
ncbi:TRAP transporter permease [Pseudalkalibacillus sp. A8]|uniref:TRAP transporter permease n=1 Tax=Pseudalkalibacillus sp. A8 TaxID=3382641 RepID=UPI0038B4F2A7